jgi:hypothetical protein
MNSITFLGKNSRAHITERWGVGPVSRFHPDAPLSSTLRVEIANYFYSQLPRVGYIDPHSRIAFSIEKPSAGQRAEEAASELIRAGLIELLLRRLGLPAQR